MRPTAFLTVRLSVESPMFGVGLAHHQIANLIVAGITVPVVDDLVTLQNSTEMLLHYKSMFIDIAILTGVRMGQHWNSDISALQNFTLKSVMGLTSIEFDITGPASRNLHAPFKNNNFSADAAFGCWTLPLEHGLDIGAASQNKQV